MSLNVLWFLTLVLICAAASALTGILLVARLRVLLVPKPRISFLSDILSFDKVLKDNITLLGKDGTLTQTLMIKGVDVSIKTPEQITTLLNHKQRCLDLLSEFVESKNIVSFDAHTERQGFPIKNICHRETTKLLNFSDSAFPSTSQSSLKFPYIYCSLKFL